MSNPVKYAPPKATVVNYPAQVVTRHPAPDAGWPVGNYVQIIRAAGGGDAESQDYIRRYHSYFATKLPEIRQLMSKTFPDRDKVDTESHPPTVTPEQAAQYYRENPPVSENDQHHKTVVDFLETLKPKDIKMDAQTVTAAVPVAKKKVPQQPKIQREAFESAAAAPSVAKGKEGAGSSANMIDTYEPQNEQEAVGKALLKTLISPVFTAGGKIVPMK